MARLESVLSFSRDDDSHDADQHQQPEPDAAAAYDNGGGISSSSDDDDDDDAGFEFAFAPPLARGGGAEDTDAAGLALADDLFAHGRLLPAYPVFERAHNHDDDASQSHQIRAPPSPDTYCAWAPRSAPGSPARGFPTTTTIKSASTGEARRFWRLPAGLGGGRSHSDGKEKFVFLQPTTTTTNKAKTTANKQQHDNNKASSAAPALQQQKQKQSTKKKQKGKAGGVTEMDMATAHRLFYANNKQGALPGADRRQRSSYLPYRTGIVGFFATAHALGKAHHPY